MKNRAGAIKDRLMGSADDPGQAAKDKAGSALDSVKDATDSARAKLGAAVDPRPRCYGSKPKAIR